MHTKWDSDLGFAAGAMLMVCPLEKGVEEEPLTSGDLDSAQDGGEGKEKLDSTAFQRPHRRPGASMGQRPPNLRRQSQALILNVHDTGEHAAAKRSDGQKGEWWENAVGRPSIALDRLSKFAKRQ